jgi:hypothetical protein
MALDLHSGEYLIKQVQKLLHRVERLMVPSHSIVVSNIGHRISQLNKQVKNGHFLVDMNVGVGSTLSTASKSNGGCPKQIQWDSLEPEIIFAISDGVLEGFCVPRVVQEEINTEKNAQLLEDIKYKGKAKLRTFQVIIA